MRNLSSVFKEQLNNDNRRYLEWLDIKLKDGTILKLREDSVWNYGIKFEDSVSDASEFKIGSAIVNKATVTINNIYDDFGKYDFEGAEIVIYVGLRISPSGMFSAIDMPWKDIDGNSILDTEGNEIYIKYDDAIIEKIRLCTMTVVEAPYQNSSIITLTCQDNMMKFDRDYSESKLEYPASRNKIIRDACLVCGVPLQTVVFDNDDYIVEARPDDENLTFRQLIAWVAQIGGQWCKCDAYGRLCIGWYDLKSYESDVLPDGKYISVNSYDTLSVNNEDVVITGIRVVEYIKDIASGTAIASHLYGSEGYVIEIKDNKLITGGKCNEIAKMIGERIVGMRFRPFTASITNNPAIEAGDICLITDRKGNSYKSIITTSTFQVGNKQSVGCGAKSAARNSAKQYSLHAQAVVENRKNLQKERTEREKALENLSKKISESSGLYTTVVQNDGGGNTYYLHNKINLESSDIVWKMTAEAWGVSTDGGETWNGGMTVDGDTVVRILDAVGVRANWIQTGEFKVVDTDGNEVFYVNCDTGIVRIKAQQFSVTGKSVEDITEAEVNKFINGLYKADIEALKKDIDSKIETWFQSTDPAINWTGNTEQILCDIDGNPILDVDGNQIVVIEESEKIQHEGDLWKNSNTGDEYIYRSGNWELMPVPDIVFDTIDGKSAIYTVQPKPPYNVGDLYFTGKEILVCKSGRENGNYSESDWEKKDYYTDDSTVTDFIENIYDPKIEDIQNQIDGKIDTYYYDYEPTMSNAPASGWTTDAEKNKHNGDLFFWKSQGYTYRFLKANNTWQWVRVKDADITYAMTAASNAQDTADGKRRVFVTEPVPPYDIGDLWSQGTKGELMCCIIAKKSGGYEEKDWEKATKYTDNSELKKFNEGLNQSELFNRLTNNGLEQGIFLKDKKIYINFSYAEGGTLKLGGVDNADGTLVVRDASGNEVGSWTKEGLDVKKGVISGSKIVLDNALADPAYISGRYKGTETLRINASGIKLGSNSVFNPEESAFIFDMNPFVLSGITLKDKEKGAGYGCFWTPKNLSISYSENLEHLEGTSMGSDNIISMNIDSGNNAGTMIRVSGDGGLLKNNSTISATGIHTTGTKNRIVNTENYASRLQYCYEMPSPMFGDIGEGYTDDTGVCIVAVDDIFRETVTSGSNYHVFLQKEGSGDIWIENKTDSYFIVKGTKNMKFSWEIKAKQKGYEFERLECYKELENDEEYINYEDIGYYTYTKYVNDLELGGEV